MRMIKAALKVATVTAAFAVITSPGVTAQRRRTTAPTSRASTPARAARSRSAIPATTSVSASPAATRRQVDRRLPQPDRDAFLNVAKSSPPRDLPYALDIDTRPLRVVDPAAWHPGGWYCRPTEHRRRTPRDVLHSRSTGIRLPQADHLGLTVAAHRRPAAVIYPIVQADLQKQTGQQVVIPTQRRLGPRQTTRTSPSPMTG